MKKIYLGRDKKLCGVCAGIANYLNVDPALIRIIFLSLAPYVAFFPLLIIYIVLALVFPSPDANYVESNTGKPLCKSTDKKVSGVCGGLADYFGIDSTIVRLIFVLLTFFIGGGIWIYIISMIFMPSYPAVNDYTQQF